MNKREKMKLIRRIWDYLNSNLAAAYTNKDEQNFDWYSDGSHTFWCAISEKPVTMISRVKPL